jgi:superfamily I DNA/RNA helicase
LALAKQGRKIAIVGKIDEAIKLLTSAWALYSDDMKNVKHPDIKMLGDWDGLEAAAKDSPELALTVRRVDQYGAKIPRIARELKASVSNEPDDADVILSTVHKAKGMEWPVVRLADDFPELMRFDKETEQWKVRKDERNLLYVAATRAVNTLHGNTALLTAVGLSRA